MAQLEQSRRDSFLRGRGLSVRLGASLNSINNSARNETEGDDADLFRGTAEFGDGDDLLLDGADESTLLEDFESNFNDKMASYEQEDTTPSAKTVIHDESIMFPDVQIDDFDGPDTPN